MLFKINYIYYLYAFIHILLICKIINAFKFPSHVSTSSNYIRCLKAMKSNDYSKVPKSSNSIIKSNIYQQKSFLSKLVILSFGSQVLPSSSIAKTYFDTDIYGDKELKIATVNKLKQKLRNAILQDISLASDFLKLAINDALGYNVLTQDGGPDGSISLELTRPENQGLERAFSVLQSVQKELQRTNQVGVGDLISFAGSEALESVGCPRIVVQVGRFDASKVNAKEGIVWNDLGPEKVKTVLESSGLSYKEYCLLLGGLGEIQRIVSETQESLRLEKKQDDEDLDDDELNQPFVPVSFGKRDEIYGKKVGKADFGSKYLQQVLKSNPSNLDPIGKCLVAIPEVKSLVQKYASNEAAFIKDISDVYLKLTLLGEEYTTRNN